MFQPEVIPPKVCLEVPFYIEGYVPAWHSPERNVLVIFVEKIVDLRAGGERVGVFPLSLGMDDDVVFRGEVEQEVPL